MTKGETPKLLSKGAVVGVLHVVFDRALSQLKLGLRFSKNAFTASSWLALPITWPM